MPNAQRLNPEILICLAPCRVDGTVALRSAATCEQRCGADAQRQIAGLGSSRLPAKHDEAVTSLAYPASPTLKALCAGRDVRRSAAAAASSAAAFVFSLAAATAAAAVIAAAATSATAGSAVIDTSLLTRATATASSMGSGFAAVSIGARSAAPAGSTTMLRPTAAAASSVVNAATSGASTGATDAAATPTAVATLGQIVGPACTAPTANDENPIRQRIATAPYVGSTATAISSATVSVALGRAPTAVRAPVKAAGYAGALPADEHAESFPGRDGNHSVGSPAVGTRGARTTRAEGDNREPLYVGRHGKRLAFACIIKRLMVGERSWCAIHRRHRARRNELRLRSTTAREQRYSRADNNDLRVDNHALHLRAPFPRPTIAG